MTATARATIAIDDSFASNVCDFGVGFLKVKYKEGDSPVAGTGTFVRFGKVSGIITAGHVIEHLPKDEVGLVRFPAVTPALQNYKLDMTKCERIVTWNKIDGNAPDIGFLRIPELDAKDLEAKGSVFYNLALERKFAPSKPEHRMVQAAAVIGIVAEWTEGAPGPGPKTRNATVGGLFGAVKKSREFKEDATDLIEVEIDFATGPKVPKSYGGVSGGALWDLHVELDSQGSVVKVGKKLRGVPFRQSADHTRFDCNGAPSLEALVAAIKGKWPD